ncbi:MAG: UDP-N-acetylmuramoyl-tripeptide--D-alanyl-D-alanine ligase [Bryobacterales bacterium]|nr:UDP-N-acetylmuramoyl-tripeptide--D-alanyl-D-alanine ligase [Bryobacterales bacterium]
MLLRVVAACLAAAAFVWRLFLFRTTVVAITGSVGKTTAKECLAAVLARHGPTVATVGNQGARFNLPITLLRARPWTRFVVAEVGIDQTGYMWRSAWLLRPDIAVILAVKRNHVRSFGDVEVTAAEKAKLLRPLTKRGLAVLNAEDSRVMAMARGARYKVRTFGASSGADLWCSDVSARWPERLSFQVHSGGEAHRVRTNLVGGHWTPSVLAALSVAVACGMTLEEAIPPLNWVEPFPARLQPVRLPSGAVILRDEYNGSVESLGPALRVLEEAEVTRRWLVISDFTDIEGSYRHRLRRLGQEAARVADLCVFLGEKSAYGRRRAIEAGMDAGAVWSFVFLEEAAAFLRENLRAGDLVLLRGTVQDKLSRLVLAQTVPVSCWRSRCGRRYLCDHCQDLVQIQA